MSQRSFGDEIGRLRVRLGLGRPALLNRLNRELLAVGYEDKVLGEKWLHRLENGQLVNLPRIIFDALGRALECTDEELARLHFLGDRNIMGMIPEITTEIKERFNLLMFDLFDDVCTIVESQVTNKPITSLPREDMNELFYTAIELIIADRRSSDA